MHSCASQLRITDSVVYTGTCGRVSLYDLTCNSLHIVLHVSNVILNNGGRHAQLRITVHIPQYRYQYNTALRLLQYEYCTRCMLCNTVCAFRVLR